MDNPNALKHLIGPEVVSLISSEFALVYPSFNKSRFKKSTLSLKDLELKDRVLLVTASLKKELPESYPEALKLILKVIKKKKLSGFQLWPISEYIGQFGLEDFSASMNAMKELTQVFTSEFAIRPYLARDHKQVLSHFEEWIEHENEHVRRWISEGTRPFLPWAQRVKALNEDVGMSLKLLEKLKHDESLYVRKSVANHLNDISKKDPNLVVKTLSEWIKKSKGHIEKIDWIRNHGLRTLIKKGHPGALKLIGVDTEAKIKISNFKIHQKNVKVGEAVSFEFILASSARHPQKLVVDYSVGFVKANGSEKGKVFKLKTFELEAGEEKMILKSHSMKKITTMTYHSGKHLISIQVNGKVLGQLSFNLKV